MTLLSTVVDFLRAGYPDGVPRQDYVPLLALLRRQLTDAEVLEVALTVLGDDEPDLAASVDRAIRAVTKAPPLDNDLSRVADRLGAVGWPLASLEEEELAEIRPPAESRTAGPDRPSS